MLKDKIDTYIQYRVLAMEEALSQKEKELAELRAKVQGPCERCIKLDQVIADQNTKITMMTEEIRQAEEYLTKSTETSNG